MQDDEVKIPGNLTIEGGDFTVKHKDGTETTITSEEVKIPGILNIDSGDFTVTHTDGKETAITSDNGSTIKTHRIYANSGHINDLYDIKNINEGVNQPDVHLDTGLTVDKINVNTLLPADYKYTKDHGNWIVNDVNRMNNGINIVSDLKHSNSDELRYIIVSKSDTTNYHVYNKSIN